MEQSNFIFLKLELFIKKYYTNELLRGIIFFVGFGLLYFLVTLFIEYFLWLKPLFRTFLFWSFVLVQLFLVIRFIIFPLFKLFKFKNGINYNQASLIIGNHFPEVADKLTNFLQLSNDSNHSELLLASISQKASSLQPIPFTNAVSFKSNTKYLPFAVLPILFFSFFFLSGNSAILSQSFNRIFHYKTQFTPPAPFEFVVLNKILSTQQNQKFILKIKTQGNTIPQKVFIVFDDERYLMDSTDSGVFQYTFENPTVSKLFHVEAYNVYSQDFTLRVLDVPAISNFEMQLVFPSYLHKPNEIVKGTGNAIVPEGTKVFWRIFTVATDKLDFLQATNRSPFSKSNSFFSFSKVITSQTDYQVISSNKNVLQHEKLNYQISIIKDQFPSITASFAPSDSNTNPTYVLGQVSDDYGLSKLQIVYYNKSSPQSHFRANINLKSLLTDRFIFSFPANLPIQKGVTYDYYFEIFDNDAINHYKSSKSAVFSSRISTDIESENSNLLQQNQSISSLSKSLQTQEKQLQDLDNISKSGKEKDQLDYKDQQKINDFIKRHELQERRMKDNIQNIKENFDKNKPQKNDDLRNEIEKRIENASVDFDKNKKLLDELKALNDKIKQEELFEKMDRFKQSTKSQNKSLEQLVELTKKFYVEKKAKQLQDKLEALSNKQENLTNDDKDNTIKKQDAINEEFNQIKDELNALNKENKELSKPLDIPDDSKLEKSINDDLKNASDDLKKDKKATAKSKQKSAANKMKQMASKMQSQMDAGSQEQLEEDVAMLRQILDNLLAFSFSQEEVMGKIKSYKSASSSLSSGVKKQQTLKLQFKHVDDSLFAMSLRNPKISDKITKEVGNALYNIDKSIYYLSDSQISKGVSHQQYTISAANTLADFLSDALNNMKMSMSGSGKPKPGKGEGDDMQLSDIIKKQEGIADKAKAGLKQGDKPGGQKPGTAGQSGANGKSGSSPGEDGEGEAQAIMQVVKEQKQLREALQNELNKKGIGSVGNSVLDQMKQLEKQLLNKGFKNDVLHRILNIKQELLKLKIALQEQGQDTNRQSEVGKKEFNNSSKPLPASVLNFFNSTEILNRQSLPLREKFSKKTNNYFNTK